MRNVRPSCESRGVLAATLVALFCFTAGAGCGGGDSGTGSTDTQDGSTIGDTGVDAGRAPRRAATFASEAASPGLTRVVRHSTRPARRSMRRVLRRTRAASPRIQEARHRRDERSFGPRDRHDGDRALCTSVAQTKSLGGAMVCQEVAGAELLRVPLRGNLYNTTDVATRRDTRGGQLRRHHKDRRKRRRANAAGRGSESNPVGVRGDDCGPVSHLSIHGQCSREGRANRTKTWPRLSGLGPLLLGDHERAPRGFGIGYALASTAGDKPLMVYVASDSTACDQTDTDYAGWGQMLPQYFNYPSILPTTPIAERAPAPFSTEPTDGERSTGSSPLGITSSFSSVTMTAVRPPRRFRRTSRRW